MASVSSLSKADIYDPWVEFNTDKLGDAYLIEKHCVLWMNWDISRPTGRDKARAALREIILEVVDHAN